MILMNDFTREPESLVVDQLTAIRKVMLSGHWILGAEVEQFEMLWAEATSCKYAIGVASGMDAIEIGLRALGIGNGDEVITTSMTAFATVLAIIRTGATPILADIEPDTAILSLESVNRCLSSNTKAVIIVHLYGRAGPASEFRAMCEDKGIHLIEDCAQAHRAKLGNVPVGSFGAFAAWSFYPTKNLGAIGDAGAITTDSAEIARTCLAIRNYGQTERYHHPILGLNSRLDEIQASILQQRVKFLDEWIDSRRRIAMKLNCGINNPLVELPPLEKILDQHVYHLYVVKSSRRDELSAHLKSSGVSSLVHYPIPIHGQIPCVSLPRDPMGLSVTENHADQCLSLPCHPYLFDSETQKIIEAVNSFK